jgi:hypothetical protein
VTFNAQAKDTLTDELRGSIPLQATMRRLIYDMYYAEEISVDIAIKLLDKLNKIRDKKRY